MEQVNFGGMSVASLAAQPEAAYIIMDDRREEDIGFISKVNLVVDAEQEEGGGRYNLFSNN